MALKKLTRTKKVSKEVPDTKDSKATKDDQDTKKVAVQKSTPKKPKAKKTKNNLSLYSNLSHRRQTKKDKRAREKAERLAKLPKNPVARFFVRLSPKHFFGFWFSWRGLKTILISLGVIILMGVIGVAGLFAYYQKDLDTIRPGELAKRVQSTVNKYYDRHGELLWEDKGSGNYKLVVDGNEISTYMRQATVAIEDKDFYNHKGISISGIFRALLNNVQGGATQGGSTLTQQLIKQVYFSEEADDRGMSGIPRKIKEMILAIEVERMYDKEQIITLYMNESPYGGRRNGVESGAQTYFGKSSKDLNIAESALLAAIPNNPAVLNPYNYPMNEALVERQHKVIDHMLELGYITDTEAKDAKAYPILDSILPEQDQYANIKAPHFILEVKKQLEAEFGVKTIRAGGLSITTTLDYQAQKYAEEAVAAGAAMAYTTGADNIALSSVDVQTGQVIAMVGSIGWDTPGYGQENAATSLLEPGSSIKPIADYAPLFQQRPGVNYGPGSILKDENINQLYCNNTCEVGNSTGKTYGNVTIRQSLGNSLNRPAIKAMYIAGVPESLTTARELGDLSYCTDNAHAGLSAAIGGGCTVKQIEHTNAYASLARGGTYKPLAYIMEVKNNSDEVIKRWEDTEGKQAIDPQAAYMVSDILSDQSARSLVFGGQSYSYGFTIPGIWTASKTGTTDKGGSAKAAKDSWMMSYSSAIAVGVWTGVHDGAALKNGDNSVARRVVHNYMENTHNNVYAPQGKWTSGDKVARPAGIQTLTVNGKTDIWPSWFNKDNTGTTKETMIFDSISKRKATTCTPESARIEVEVLKVTDPITKKESYVVDGYDPENDDDIHSCSDASPIVSSITISGSGTSKTITASITPGTGTPQSYTISVDGTTVSSGSISGNSITYTTTLTTGQVVKVRIVDSLGYEDTASRTVGP